MASVTGPDSDQVSSASLSFIRARYCPQRADGREQQKHQSRNLPGSPVDHATVQRRAHLNRRCPPDVNCNLARLTLLRSNMPSRSAANRNTSIPAPRACAMPEAVQIALRLVAPEIRPSTTAPHMAAATSP
jgi:hypothetical protein